MFSRDYSVSTLGTSCRVQELLQTCPLASNLFDSQNTQHIERDAAHRGFQGLLSRAGIPPIVGLKRAKQCSTEDPVRTSAVAVLVATPNSVSTHAVRSRNVIEPDYDGLFVLVKRGRNAPPLIGK